MQENKKEPESKTVTKADQIFPILFISTALMLVISFVIGYMISPEPTFSPQGNSACTFDLKANTTINECNYFSFDTSTQYLVSFVNIVPLNSYMAINGRFNILSNLNLTESSIKRHHIFSLSQQFNDSTFK